MSHLPIKEKGKKEEEPKPAGLLHASSLVNMKMLIIGVKPSIFQGYLRDLDTYMTTGIMPFRLCPIIAVLEKSYRDQFSLESMRMFPLN